VNLKSTGTRYVKAKHISYWLPNKLEFRGKSENINGLQLADLIASPISRNVIDKVSHEDYRIIEKNLENIRVNTKDTV
jgi:hypothetical protein